MKTISVIVPVYNCEKYLGQCLDSLVHQTYRSLEIVMVDDGSVDSSGRICDEFAQNYPQFKVIHKQNEGLGMARNTGLDAITGEYVTFVDADDYLDKSFIQELYEHIITEKVDVCKSGFKRVVDTGKISHNIRYGDEVFKGDRARKVLLPRMIGSRPDKKDSIEMAVCATLYRCDPIHRYHIRFPSERELISEDLVFNMGYMQYADGACTISKLGYNYRINSGSLTTVYREDRFRTSCAFYKAIEKKLKELKYDDMTFLRSKRMFFVYLKMCIAQEAKRTSGLGSSDSIQNIRTICNAPIIRQVTVGYPTGQLGVKQKMFLFLIKHKCARILYCCACAGLLR